MDYESGYMCLRGDVDTSFLSDSDFFMLDDAIGRTWICKMLPPLSYDNLDFLLADFTKTVTDIVVLQTRLGKIAGDASEGLTSAVRFNRQPEGYTKEEDIQELRIHLSGVVEQNSQSDEPNDD